MCVIDLFVTHASILSCDTSTFSFGNASTAYTMLRYLSFLLFSFLFNFFGLPIFLFLRFTQKFKKLNKKENKRNEIQDSVRFVAPLHSRRVEAFRRVSYYAFSQGWLLPSLPLRCLFFHPSFPHSESVSGPYLWIWAVSLLSKNLLAPRLSPIHT